MEHTQPDRPDLRLLRADVSVDAHATITAVAESLGVAVSSLLETIACPEEPYTSRPTLMPGCKKQLYLRVTEEAKSTVTQVATNAGLPVASLLEHMALPQGELTPRWKKIIENARHITNINRKQGPQASGNKTRGRASPPRTS